MTRAFRTVLLATVVSVVTALATAPASSAAQAAQPGCNATGSGAICHGSYVDEHLGGYDGTCPQGFDILENGHDEGSYTTFFDRNGNLTGFELHDRFPVGNPLNVLYNSVTDKSVPYFGYLTTKFTLAVPGDFSTATSTASGNLYTSVLPGRGILVHDVGTLAFAPDGSIAFHGPKELFFGHVDALCSALA